MSRRTLAYLVAAVLAVAASLLILRPAMSNAAVAVRIMPLGDSITAGTGCWRAMLWNRLQTTGYTNIDFVGSQSGAGCTGPAYDVDHEGHGGYSAIGIADQNQLPPWLSAASPDIVLMHLGTNDMWAGNIPLQNKLNAFTKLVTQMRANNPNMKIIVAQIIPMAASACPTCPAQVIELDNAIPGWAAGLSTGQSPIYVADLWTGFNTATDTTDGVHPNDAGYQKMANSWYPVLASVLSGVTPSSPATNPSTPPSSSSAPPTSSSSPTAPGSCTATHKMVSEWPGGFQGEVRVTNNGTAASTAWTVTLNYANGQQITQVWNASAVQTGSTVTAKNLSYNGALAPGGATSFGFLASGTNASTPPAVTCALG